MSDIRIFSNIRLFTSVAVAAILAGAACAHAGGGGGGGGGGHGGGGGNFGGSGMSYATGSGHSEGGMDMHGTPGGEMDMRGAPQYGGEADMRGAPQYAGAAYSAGHAAAAHLAARANAGARHSLAVHGRPEFNGHRDARVSRNDNAPKVGSDRSATSRTNAMRNASGSSAVAGALHNTANLRFPNARAQIVEGRGENGAGRHRHGWAGPLFWPFAYHDIYDYTLWGYGYDDAFWDYGYGEIYAGIFSPYSYDDLAAYEPQQAGPGPDGGPQVNARPHDYANVQPRDPVYAPLQAGLNPQPRDFANAQPRDPVYAPPQAGLNPQPRDFANVQPRDPVNAPPQVAVNPQPRAPVNAQPDPANAQPHDDVNAQPHVAVTAPPHMAANPQPHVAANPQSHVAASPQPRVAVTTEPKVAANAPPHVAASPQPHVAANAPARDPVNAQPHGAINAEPKVALNVPPRDPVNPRSRGAQETAPDRLTQMCGEDSRDIAGMPIDAIQTAIAPNDLQRAALDDLANASVKAAAIIRAACPKQIALTAPGRLTSMRQRVEAMVSAAGTVQPALQKFYDLLSDEQKTRLSALGGDQPRTEAAKNRNGLPAAGCGANQANMAAWPNEEIEARLHLTEAQRASLADLQDATARAQQMLSESCPTGDQAAVTPPARLEAVHKRLEVILIAVKTVRAALDDFYAGLSDEQKAQFEAIGQRRSAASDQPSGARTHVRHPDAS